MRWSAATGLGLILMLGTAPAFAQPANQASAELRDANGQVVGTATITQEAGGIRLSVQVRNLPPGTHGIHFHEVGRCEPPSFMTAGEHYNPTRRQHGLQNPAGPHAGDLPNLEVAANGTAQYSAMNSVLTLGTGQATLFDADGSALVIHTNADDNVSDPSGNSGGRIACGVVQRAAAPAQIPSALPRTGDAVGPGGPALPLAAAGATVLLAGLGLLRRR